MRKKYLPILLLLLFHIYYSQSTPANNNFNLPKIVPPSQETFANSRVNFEQSPSGEFSYELPVYNDTKTPVSLSYTSGVRVDDIGSGTGMSWQLRAGGVISRVVKDETDENKENWKPATINETADLQRIRNAARPGNPIDTEYDWFNFSVSNGLNGSFYIDKDLNVFIESRDKVKIEISIKNSPLTVYGKLLEFKLTDKFGNEYYFGGSETNTERTTYENSGPNTNAYTGWYLFKVITPEKKETLFNYSIENLNYYVSLDAGFNIQQNCSQPATANQYTYSDITKSRSTLQSYKPKLVNITEDDRQINFIYSKERKDLFNSNPGNNLLTSIEIKSSNRLIDTYTFEYFDTLSPIAATYYGLPQDESSTRNRHFLKSVKNVNKNTKTEFEYYDLASLPARFSLSTDYFGYANGVANSSPFPAIASDNNFGIFKGFSNVMPLSILSADKKVKPLLASVGNLRRIIHPTKGVSEIFYEPNSSMGPVNELVKEKTSISANHNKCNPSNSNPSGSFTFVSNGTPVEYYGTAFFDDSYGCNEPNATRDIHSLKITNLTTGAVVFSKSNKVSEPFKAETGTSYYPLNTINGNTYKIEYSVSAGLGAVSGNIFFDYNEHTVTKDELKYFGGSRVSSIKESTIEGGNYLREFYYNKLNEISSQKTSVADYNAIYIMAQQQQTSKSCLNSTMPYLEIRDVYSAYQNSLLPYFNNRNNKIFYTDITEVIGGKSAIEKKFSYQGNLDPFTGRQPQIYNIPKTNYGELKSNLLLEENSYKFENGAYSRMVNKTYKYDYSQMKSLKSYVFRENFMYNPDPSEDQLINISYGFYENYYGFYNPTMITNLEYLPGNVTLTTTTTNSYASPVHYQLTSSKIQYPDNSVRETSYAYAQEKGNQLLISKNMVGIPLETTTTQTIGSSTKILDKSETLYPTSVPTPQTGSLVLPLSIRSFDKLSNTPSTDITYDKYDAKGNILQYTTDDGVPVAILWGYNGNQPIVKVEGMTYDQLTAIPTSAVVSASNNDASDPTKEDLLLNALNTFRKQPALAGKKITTYTHDPLIGVTTITPPSGIRESFVYDTAGRLKEGNIRGKNNTGTYIKKKVKELNYNYKP